MFLLTVIDQLSFQFRHQLNKMFVTLDRYDRPILLTMLAMLWSLDLFLGPVGGGGGGGGGGTTPYFLFLILCYVMAYVQ